MIYDIYLLYLLVWTNSLKMKNDKAALLRTDG